MGGGGGSWETIFQRVMDHVATYDRSEAQKHTYVLCFETKVGTPGH